MFTGLISEMGDVISLMRKRSGASLTVKAVTLQQDAVIGDSISISGACLTVTNRRGDLLTFDLSEETLRSTNLGELKGGDKVNLEPSLRADGKLGGHFVTGHVDAVGKVLSKTVVGDTLKIVIGAPSDVTGLLVGKGSVAVDGISLTVVDVSEDTFSIVIIPHTAAVTTIGLKGIGETVNLEADIIGKYVARFLAGGRTKATGGDDKLMQSLTKAGYI
ncbi:MAG TPA: riboflavin synthase [Thermodesulfovibrionales bacterium]|nr:riboflavin synthase [Thermodesulfovibrionales bacterium]